MQTQWVIHVGRGVSAHVGPDEATDQEPISSAMPLGRAKFLYQFRRILRDPNPPQLANEIEEAKRVLRAAGYQLPDHEHENQPVTADTDSPPVGDFSTSECYT